MPAPHEKPSSGVPLLEYGDLVDLERTKGSWPLNPILSADKIPVHPAVFESTQFYTPEFARRVLVSVPDSIRQDVIAIEAKAGPKVPVEITDRGVQLVRTKPSCFYRDGDTALFTDIIIEADATSIGIAPRLSGSAVNLWIDTSRPLFERSNRHPMPKDKAERYKVDYEKYRREDMLTWHSHNSGDVELPLLLIFRNFAIMFNNLGLQELGVK